MAGGIDTSIYRQQPTNPLQGLIAISGAAEAMSRTQSIQTETALRQLGALHGEFSALASKHDLSLADIRDSASRLVQAGLATPQDAEREVAIAARIGDNPTALRNFAGTHLQSVIDSHERLRSAYGTVETQDTGDNLLTRTVSPVTGVRNLSAVPKTLSPTEKANRLGTFQGGQQGSVPVSGTTDRYGYPLKAPIGGAQAGAGGGAGSMAPAGFVPSAPSLGQTRVAEGGAEQYVRDLQAAAGSAGELQNLQSALGNVQNLPATGTGPGVTGRNRIASFLNAAGLGSLPGVDPKKIEDLDEATSYLNSAARAGTLNAAPGQAPGAGAPTTPNIGEISQPAAVNLIRAQIGLKRLQQAQARSYQGRDSGAAYAQHAASFAGDQDPRAYSFDLRTPAEKQKLIDSLGPKDGAPYKKFVKSLRTAHDLGLTNAAGQ